MALSAQKLTLADFIAWEAEQGTRNEFHGGAVVAMVGARRVHGLVGLNLAAVLKQHLKCTRCRVFVESMKLQAGNNIFYPDVFVTCDASDLQTEMVFRAPSLVADVLSDSTQAFDRGLKLAACRQLPTLQEYVLIDPDNRHVEVFRRNERRNFELIDQTAQAELLLSSVGLRLPMPELFDGLSDGAA